MKLKQGDRVGITACSNGPDGRGREPVEALCRLLRSVGLQPVYSSALRFNGPFASSAKQRADALMELFSDDRVRAIFDISGGDLANQILEHLDFTLIRSHPKPFFGYSDLTVLLNALYRCAGLPCVLWQAKNLLGKDAQGQLQRFCSSLMDDGDDGLFHFSCRLLQGAPVEGTVVGGNIRCLLKLAGTPYFPELSQKILFLESYGGTPAVLASLLSQLRQIGAFHQVKGVLLGTFSQMEREGLQPDITSLLLEAVGNPSLPVAKTMQIGHEPDSRALVIGGTLCLSALDGRSSSSPAQAGQRPCR